MLQLKDFFSKNKDTFQLAYGIILIVLIPLLVAYNTISIINRYNESIDVTIQRHALAVGRSINVLIKDDLNNEGILQNKIEQLTKNNPDDFQNIEILIPEGENFRIIASAKKSNIERITKLDYYSLWRLPLMNSELRLEQSKVTLLLFWKEPMVRLKIMR